MNLGDSSEPSGAREAVLAAARELIARESENPPGNERSVADWLRSRASASPVPFDVEVLPVAPDRPNVVARAGDPDRGRVLLTGHTDVVPADTGQWSTDPYDPVVQGGRLIGRGAADMKGALAAMLVATEQYFAETDTPGQVCLAFVVDEEHGGTGTRTLVDDGIEADAAIVGEPTDMNVCTAIKGVARYEVSVHGRKCHSGRPDAGKDAVRGLTELLERIVSLDRHLEATSHEVLAHEDITVTEVQAGLAPNVVADRATTTVDWRFLPGPTTPDVFDERLASHITPLTAEGTEYATDIERVVFARAGETDPESSVVDAVTAATRDVGLDARLVGFDAATDARFLIHDAAIPTVHFGPGSLAEDAHTVGESVAVENLLSTVAVYKRALHRLL